jgi:hypothetical protein
VLLRVNWEVGVAAELRHAQVPLYYKKLDAAEKATQRAERDPAATSKRQLEEIDSERAEIARARALLKARDEALERDRWYVQRRAEAAARRAAKAAQKIEASASEGDSTGGAEPEEEVEDMTVDDAQQPKRTLDFYDM